MGTFLLFNSGSRLCRVQHMVSNYGSIDPAKVFHSNGEADLKGEKAIELHPAVLNRIRSHVFDDLVMNAVLTKRGLKVDSLHDISERIIKQAIKSAEWKVAVKSKEVRAITEGLLHVSKCYDVSLDDPAKYVDAETRQLQDAIQELLALRNGSAKPQPNKVLTDLAGKFLPI